MNKSIKRYRSKGKMFEVNHEEKTVSCPSSLEEKDYPQEVLHLINDEKYFKQLNIF